MSKQVTIKSLIKASKKNGFPWARQNKPTAGGKSFVNAVFSCVVGQGVINLDGRDFAGMYRHPDEQIKEAFIDIFDYNDMKATSYEDAVKYMETRLAPYLNRRVTI